MPISGSNSREIVAAVEAAIAAGELTAGDKLPSVRTLARDAGVSPTTVSAALAELRRRGVVVSRPRSGTRVAGRPPATPAPAAALPKGARDLSSGNPDPTLLPDALAAFKRLDTRPRLYGDETIDAGLRAVATKALEQDGIDPAHLCVVNGALDGIERALAARLSPGDRVAVEDPGYAAVVDAVRALGLTPVPVPVDDKGMDPDILRAAQARSLIVTPRGQNPTGATIDARRARELDRALDPATLVIEDDHLGPVAGPAAPTLTTGRSTWITVRSVSKWLGPDLRLAILAGDAATVARVERRQAVGPGWVSTLIQRAVAALWADEDAAALADQAATVYAGRRNALTAALADHGIDAPAPSGLNVWIPVPDEDAAVAGLLATGWAVTAGARFRLAAPPAIRVTISTLRPEEARRLAADLAAVLNPASRTRAA